MTCGLHVHASYSLPEWQAAVKLTFFAPWNVKENKLLKNSNKPKVLH